MHFFPLILLMVLVQDTSKKSPMQLINEVPPIKVEGRIVACEGGQFASIFQLFKQLIWVGITLNYYYYFFDLSPGCRQQPCAWASN